MKSARFFFAALVFSLMFWGSSAGQGFDYKQWWPTTVRNATDYSDCSYTPSDFVPQGLTPRPIQINWGPIPGVATYFVYRSNGVSYSRPTQPYATFLDTTYFILYQDKEIGFDKIYTYWIEPAGSSIGPYRLVIQAQLSWPALTVTPTDTSFLLGWERYGGNNWIELYVYDSGRNNIACYTARLDDDGHYELRWNEGPLGDYWGGTPIVTGVDYTIRVRRVSDIFGSKSIFTAFGQYRLAEKQAIPSGSFATASAAASYPNPFNSTTTISYDLRVEGHVLMAVFNSRGQLVAKLVDSNQPAGHHQIIWDATSIPSGMYFCRIMTPTSTRTIRMALMR